MRIVARKSPSAIALCVIILFFTFHILIFVDSLLFVHSNRDLRNNSSEVILDPVVEEYFDSLDFWRTEFDKRENRKIYLKDGYIWDWEYCKHVAHKLDSILTDYPIIIRDKEEGETIRKTWRAFNQWRHSPTAKHLSYNDFKNTLLPFNQSDYVSESFEHTEFFRHNYESAEELIDSLIARKEFATLVGKHSKMECSELGAYKLVYLGGWGSKDCKTEAFETCDLFHKCGIPCVVETTPAWPDRLSRHYWCSAPDSNGLFRPFTPPYNNLGEDWEEYLSCAGKVYRICYSRSHSSALDFSRKREPIPDNLNDHHLQDVTSLYQSCHNLDIHISNLPEGRLVYLSHFSPLPEKYRAVGWGIANKRLYTASFEQVPENKLFFPVVYENSQKDFEHILRPCTNPFIIDSTGRVIEFKPNGKTCSVALTRKYPIKKRLADLWPADRKVWILACNNLSELCDTLGKFPAEQIPYMRDIFFNTNEEYRYYEIVSEDGSFIHFGELEWFCQQDEKVPEITNNGSNLEGIFDKDVETFAGHEKWIFDFQKPTLVNHIRYIPRTANNVINIGDTYSLFYYDMDWKLIERRIAQSQCLDFQNVPQGCLLWLHDETKGKEELPFIWKNDKQIFFDNYVEQSL